MYLYLPVIMHLVYYCLVFSLNVQVFKKVKIYGEQSIKYLLTNICKDVNYKNTLQRL